MTKSVNFINNKRESREIGQAENLDQVYEIIKKFIDDHNYVSYYTRRWVIDDVMWFDVGSHTEFFTWGNNKNEN